MRRKSRSLHFLEFSLSSNSSIAYQLSTRHFPLRVETLETSPEGAGPGSRNPPQHLLAC